MRAAFARIMLEEPDLLILDEPTNHLDIDAVEWLEGLIKRYAGSVLVVSQAKPLRKSFSCIDQARRSDLLSIFFHYLLACKANGTEKCESYSIYGCICIVDSTIFQMIT